MLLSYTSKSTPEIGSTMKVIILFLLFEVAFGAPENGKSRDMKNRDMKKREMRSLGKNHLFIYFLFIFAITFFI